MYFNHVKFTVLDLEKSIKFYEDALGLKRRVDLKPRMDLSSICTSATRKQDSAWN